MSELQSKKKKWEGYSSQRERLSKDTKTWGSLLCVGLQGVLWEAGGADECSENWTRREGSIYGIVYARLRRWGCILRAGKSQ